MSDDENEICPLCCEELDLSDKSFYPCKCGYQVCMWCWHRIRETESGLCPACRTPYGDDPHEFSAVDMEEVVKANKEKVAAEKRERERLRAGKAEPERMGGGHHVRSASGGLGGGGGSSSAPSSGNASGFHAAGGVGSGGGGSAGGAANFASALAGGGGSAGPALGGASTFDGADLVAALGSAASAPSHSTVSTSASGLRTSGPPDPPKDRSTLATMRVIRRNLVYAVGLPPSIALEEVLRRPEYFGQYGKVSKIVINRNHNPGTDPRRASASAYVTFAHKEDTLACILALDGFYHDGRNIRASYGTSKYCSAFIKNVRCNNPDCTYLHHMGDAEDTFSKQEIQAGYVTSGRDVLARQQQIMAQQAAAVFGAGGGPSRRKVGGGGPSGTGRASNGPVFPPPTYDEPLPRRIRAQSALLGRGAHMAGAPSAASVVAGIGVGDRAPPPAPHTQLTPLTPLKRAGSMPLSTKAPSAGGISVPLARQQPPQPLVGGSSDLTPAESLALEQKKEAALTAQQERQREMMALKAASSRKGRDASSSAPGSPSHSSVGSSGSRGSRKQQQSAAVAHENGAASKQPAGGPTPIGAISGSNLHMGSPLIGGSFSGSLGGAPIGEPPAAVSSFNHTGSGILGGQPLALSNENGVIGGSSLAPAGNSFGLGLLSDSSGSGVDKWGAAGGGGQSTYGGSGALWGGNESANRPAPIGSSRTNNLAPGGDVGGMSLFGANSNAFGNSGSSALANMLGIELPTGSGSLRELGGHSMQAPVGAVGAVGGPGAIGANKPNGMLRPIGAPSTHQGVGAVGVGGGGVPIGGYSGGGGNNNDMALLQSLLPGVNITSGNAYRPAAPQYHGAPQPPGNSQQQPVGVASLNQGSAQWNGGANNAGQQQEQQRGSNIW